MRIAIYARVSTTDKEQNPDTQLLPLREFVTAQGWQVIGEHVDHAPANDLRGRTAWRALLDLAAKRRVDVILVWKLDRAFRSVAHMAQTVEQFRRWGVGLRSYSEPWLDTSGTSPVADLMLNIMASFAQFERGLIAERVRAGMDRAKRQGKHVGRPTASVPAAMLDAVRAGTVSQREAARRLNVGASTVRRNLSHRKGSEIGHAGTPDFVGVSEGTDRRTVRISFRCAAKDGSGADPGPFGLPRHFWRVHSTLKVAPAVAAGLETYTWNIGKLYDMAISSAGTEAA